MKKLSDKRTGDRLTANEWDGHSLELENVVTNTQIKLDEDDSEQLYKAIFETARQPLYLEYDKEHNKYNVINRKEIKYPIDNKLIDGYTGFIVVDKTNDVEKPSIVINDVEYNCYTLNGDELPKNSLKPKILIPFIYQDEEFKFGLNNVGLSKEYILWFTDYSKYIDFTENQGKIINYVLFAMRVFQRGDTFDIHLVWYIDIEKGSHGENASKITVRLMEFLKDYLDCYNKETGEPWKIVDYNYSAGRYTGGVTLEKEVDSYALSTLWTYDNDTIYKNIATIESYDYKDYSEVVTVKYHCQFTNVKVK
jgi:hypothetical protein